MYVPKYSEINDQHLIEEFMQAHPFATFISSGEQIEANHYPFLIKKEEDKTILWTHVARSNPQWTNIQKKNRCLVIFTGPHAYMSPSYYINPLNVPTWSYTAVHAQCLATIETDELIQQDLMKELVTHFETTNKTNWKYDLPEEFNQKLLKAIVWIKCEVIELQAKFKLSQNRNKEDYQYLLNQLKKRNDDNSNELLYYLHQTTPTHLKD